MGESVRLAYDRMHSHFIVSDWLGRSPSAVVALKLFGQNGALRRLAENRDNWSSIASICEEMALQWPARYGVELFDSRPRLPGDPFWARIYLRALRNSAPTAWTASTGKWLQQCLEALGDDRDERVRHIVRLMARIGHPALIGEVHNYLSAHPLAVRDSWWTIPLSERFNDEHESQLVMWPLEHKKIRFDETSALSYATSLSWLTAVTRRSLRASATKALAVVAGSELAVVPSLLRRFQNVNDPYVLQALCLAVYGACLRSTDGRAVEAIARCVRELWPTKDRWPVDIISRHALAGIVELAVYRNPASGFDLREVSPPYKSKWVSVALSWSEIQRRKSQADSKKLYGLSKIVTSCIPERRPTRAPRGAYGDFGRYVVDWAVYAFLPHRFGQENPPKPAFAPDLPHRYIISRVLELGWTPELFNDFDRSRGSGDRSRNAVERIGKKYQWIALAEFLARAADRFPIFSLDWPERRTRAYRDPEDVHQRFFADTSLIHVADPLDATRASAGSVPKAPSESLWGEPNDDLWLLSPQGIPDPAAHLLESANDGVLLRGHYQWRQDHPEDRTDSDRRYRSVSMGIGGYAIRRTDLAALDRWIGANKANEEPSPHTYRGSLFGELYWSRSARAASIEMVDTPEDAWQSEDTRSGAPPVPMIPLAAEYSNESDDSRDGGLYGLLPSRWLAETLELRSGPAEFTFTDRAGAAVCWQIADACRNAAYGQRGHVSRVLDRDELVMVWWVRGEKMAINGEYNFEGPVLPFLQGLYWLDGDRVRGWTGVLFDENFRTGKSRECPPPFVLTPVWSTPEPSPVRARGRANGSASLSRSKRLSQPRRRGKA